MRILLTHLFVLAATWVFCQQNVTLKGTILDDQKEALIAATVVALNPTDSIMAGFAITDADGKFSIKKLRSGDYILQITFVGFGTFARNINLPEGQNEVDLGVIELTAGSNKLDEIVVEAEFIPLVIKKDTVEYNADAYRVRPNANVEELLKQLPGIEVESDGTINAQGEEVRSVTVDGKKFFGDDPKMATKNLPAEAVKKVQVFDKKSDKAEFSGVDDGNTTKTINLELKEDKKIGFFGNLEAGYGTDDRYLSKISLNKFSPKYQLAGIVSYNNVNQQGFSYSEYQNLVGSSSFRGVRNISGPVNFDGMGNGDTKSLTGGLNFAFTPLKKTEVTTSYFLTYVDRLAIEEIFRENTLGDIVFFDQNFGNTSTESLGHNINFEVEAKPDSLQRIDLDLSYRKNLNDRFGFEQIMILDANNLPSNESAQENNADASSDDLSFSAEYNRRLGKAGRILTLNGRLGSAIQKDSTYLDQDNTVYRNGVPITTEVVQDQISRQDDGSYQVSANYKEPLGKGHFLDFNVQRRNFNSERIKDFLDYDLENLTVRTLNDTLSTLVNNDVIYTRGGLEYTIDKDKYLLAFRGHYNISEVSGDVPGQSLISNTYRYFLPAVTFDYDDPNIRFNYRTSVNEPSVSQLQTIVDNSNPIQLYVGNPNLRPEYRHDFSLRYFFFDRFNLNNMFAFLSYTYTKDRIVTAQTIDENNIRYRTPLNTRNQQAYRASLSYGTPIRPLKIKTNIRAGANYSKGINFINNTENDVTTFSPNIRINLENTNNKVVSLSTNASFNYNQNTYSLNADQNSDYFTQNYSATLLLTLPKSWYIDADWSYQIFSQEDFADDNTLQILSASISKGFMNDRLTAKLYGFDLLNQNRGLNRSISDTYLEQSITNSIQRYFMLSVVYKLSEFAPQQDRFIIRRH